MHCCVLTSTRWNRTTRKVCLKNPDLAKMRLKSAEFVNKPAGPMKPWNVRHASQMRHTLIQNLAKVLLCTSKYVQNCQKLSKCIPILKEYYRAQCFAVALLLQSDSWTGEPQQTFAPISRFDTNLHADKTIKSTTVRIFSLRWIRDKIWRILHFCTSKYV